MKCVILAAGYATRLYPLTENMPKSLLPIGESTILEFILKKVEAIASIDAIFIVTNAKFYSQFREWVDAYRTDKQITVFSDGTTDNESRLGAIADLQLAIEYGGIQDDLLVLAGDNLFDFSLKEFDDFYRAVGSDCICAHELSDMAALQRTGVIEVDTQHKVLSFEEKPKQPKSNFAVPPFYLYQRNTLSMVKIYLSQGNNPDAPGNFIPWLIKHKPVYAYLFQGKRYDIGNLESYRQAVQAYNKGRIVE